MAKANQATQKVEEEQQATGTAVAVQQGGAVATAAAVDFAADAGSGMEGATQESYAIPFLATLQKGSPQVDEASGQALEGAKSGMFFNTVTQKLMDGKAGVLLVPCAYRRVFVHWGPREGQGGGFKGEVSPEAVALLREQNKIVELDGKLYFPLADGSVHEKKSDRLADTRNHYCLLIDPDTGFTSQVLVSLTSTQIKKSKQLMSLLAGIKLLNASGMPYTPATYANKVRIVTIPESNDKGTWHGVKFEHAGQVDSAHLYAEAKAFHALVIKGGVAANYDQAAAASGVGGDEEGKPGF